MIVAAQECATSWLQLTSDTIGYVLGIAAFVIAAWVISRILR